MKQLNNKIIIISFILILIIIYFALKKKSETFEKRIDNKIKKLNNLLKTIDRKILVLNQQFEAFIYYLHGLKNDSGIYQLLKPKSIVGKKKVRIGSAKDGGYILLDDFENIKIDYSFGINNEISFDDELANKNIDVFMYDHTIQKLPFSKDKFHWKKIGITAKEGEKNI